MNERGTWEERLGLQVCRRVCFTMGTSSIITCMSSEVFDPQRVGE